MLLLVAADFTEELLCYTDNELGDCEEVRLFPRPDPSAATASTPSAPSTAAGSASASASASASNSKDEEDDDRPFGHEMHNTGETPRQRRARWRVRRDHKRARRLREEQEKRAVDAKTPTGIFFADGLIPAAVLQSMEAQLQVVADNPNKDFHPGLALFTTLLSSLLFNPPYLYVLG